MLQLSPAIVREYDEFLMKSSQKRKPSSNSGLSSLSDIELFKELLQS